MKPPTYPDEIVSVYGRLRPIFVPVESGLFEPLEFLRMIAIGRFHLSSEDIQLLQYLAEGLSNKEIAARLDVADYTVKNRLRRTKRKLGVTGRSQAIEFAVRNGFGVPLDSLSQFASESRSKGRA